MPLNLFRLCDWLQFLHIEAREYHYFEKVVHRTPPESPLYLHNYILWEKVPSEIDLISVYSYGVFVIGDCGIIV